MFLITEFPYTVDIPVIREYITAVIESRKRKMKDAYFLVTVPFSFEASRYLVQRQSDDLHSVLSQPSYSGYATLEANQ